MFLFPSVILLDNSSCSSLMVNNHNYLLKSNPASMLLEHSIVWKHMNTKQCGDFAVNYYINLTCFIYVRLMHMNNIKFIDLFMLKLCNLNEWKIVMQLNYIKCQFRPNFFCVCRHEENMRERPNFLPLHLQYGTGFFCHFV